MKIIRVSTVPESMNAFCKGLLRELTNDGYEIVVVSSPKKELKDIEEREHVRTIPVDMRRDISVIQDIKSLIHLTKVFWKEKPDMVHSITPKAGLLSMIAGWITRVPVRLHTFTGLVFPTSKGLKRKVLTLTDRITCFCATHINPEGQGVKDDLSNYGITHKPLTILGNGNIKGIDESFFDPASHDISPLASELYENRFNFIFIGRLVGDKGVNELILAFEQVYNLHPEAQLFILGEYETDHDHLSDHSIAQISAHPGIKHVGFQHDIRPWLLASDVLILPSYREGFPNVVLEAGAMGVPAIVTDVNGSREIIEDGINGLIVRPQDEELLADKMKYVIENYGHLSKMKDVTRERIVSRFRQSIVRNALKEYYKSILKRKD